MANTQNYFNPFLKERLNFLIMNAPRNIIVLFLLLSMTTCSWKKNEALFKLRDASSTGLTFNNEIAISGTMNAVTFEYIYNGGGAAVGDVNNDGLKDLFFAGNMVSSRLYLNRGNLKFEDITETSGTTTTSWCTGASFVDINADGLLDLYVCVAGLVTPELRKNLFYINTGIDEHGIPHFENQAHALGLDDDGYSTMGVFFDYDKDHDLDMYLLTNSMEGNQRNVIKPISINGEAPSTDRFYRNNGDGTFTNWSRETGILIEGYGLGVALCDINQDHWIDVYCANDFISSDLLWINNQDGTFTEQAGEYFKHFTNNGMGMDVADYNNDGLLDVAVVDMMPATNIRQKMMFVFRNMDRLNMAIETGYLPQFMRNTLQLNMGRFPDGRFRFSEVGYLSGIHQTDWSWAPLFVDFDNDGWKDLLITNGYRKDVTNLDYINKIIRETKFGSKESNQDYLVNAMNELTDVQLPNYVFRNNGDLSFTDKSSDWGLDIPTFSNGTVTADLDNDGDLDIIVNNIDQEVHLYENLLDEKNTEKDQNHFLFLQFDSQISESDKIGTKIWIFQHGNNQYFEYSPYRGYKSTVDPDIHVGLGTDNQVDSMIVQWPDGMVQQFSDVKGGSTFVISRSESLTYFEGIYISQFNKEQEELLFHDITEAIRLDIKHNEAKFNDLQRTPSLIRSLTKNGPSISIGDMDGDGLDDVFMGGDRNHKSSIFKQETDNTFSEQKMNLESIPEDMGSLLFDADGDGDLDLYVVSGGSQWMENNAAYQDRLYFNVGSGIFTLKADALPKISSSGSCVVASDFDFDGDLDLFVGGRLVPNKYPSPAQSYLLENVDGKFLDQSEKLGEKHGMLGMVTSALWTDVNNDNAPDLMIVGEWMQITVLINSGDSFVDQSEAYHLSDTDGWWNSINGGDFDNDGDIDYLLGNYGLNSFYKASIEQPLEIYAKDFDHNGSFDPIMTNYILGESYIVHPRNILLNLIPSIENRFSTFESYGNTPFKEAFTVQELEGAIHLKCTMMQSIFLENVEGRQFKIHDLPLEAQFAPVFGTVLDDFNHDNRLDIMIVGNSMADESIAGYYDASYGNVLINKGNYNWEMLDPSSTNFLADGDKKALATISIGGKQVFLITENDGFLQAFSTSNTGYNIVPLQDMDWYFQLKYKGLKRKVELYYGSGYLSASTRKIWLPDSVDEISIFNYQGESRKVSSYKKIVSSKLDITESQ